MKKLAKYLKPFLPYVFGALVMLFMQAFSDLSLPNYMSNIVNIGISQSGVEHASPELINENGLKLVKTFLSSDNASEIDAAYVPVSSSDKVGGKVISERYSDTGGKSLFALKSDITKEDRERLDSLFSTSSYAIVSFFKEMNGGTTGNTDESSALPVLNMEEVYQLIPLLETMPGDGIKRAFETAEKTSSDITAQTGIYFVRGFMSELGADMAAIQRDYIIRMGLVMLLIALIGGAATIAVSYFASRTSAGVARNLRRDVFCKVESFSQGEYDKFSTASLITRSTNDITQVQMLVGMGLRLICFAPIMGIGGIVMALRKSTQMSWIIALACVVLIGLIMVIMSVCMPKFKIMQKLVDRLNLVSRENLSGLMVIRAFNTQKHESERFDEANGDITKTNLFIGRLMSLMNPVVIMIMNGVTLMIIWVGANLVSQLSIQIGDMLAFMQYAMHVVFSFMMISMMFMFVPRAAVSADRINEVLSTDLTVLDPENPKQFNKDKRGIVEFRNVAFRYYGAEEDALSGISFTAKPGQTTALIGSTGSGKSTIANLLMRFYDVTGGEVLVDGVNVREVRQEDLREKLGYVPQKGVLLSGTIESNIKYGMDDASDEDMVKAARIAQAEGFINEKESGYDSEIAQGGTNVSGGQKQRLSIARALAKNPEILIFDDSFSALDFKTDSSLRRALNEHLGNATMIVVAQRVSTIMNAEQIIVLEQGRIAGIGTHRELLKNCPEYYEIASSQLSEAELA